MQTTPEKRPPPSKIFQLLFWISIFAILAGLLMPLLTSVRTDRGGKEGKSWVMSEEYDLMAAIRHYRAVYDRLPEPTNADKTFGLGASLLPNAEPTNSPVMVVLLDEDRYVNANHALNPQRLVFFDGPRYQSIDKPGVSTEDWQFRDPWGNPYIITMDLDGDGKCYDALYRKRIVSQKAAGSAEGYNGLQGDTNNPDADNFYLKGDVMIWSMGPDGKADANIPAYEGVNRDNVLSWQP